MSDEERSRRRRKLGISDQDKVLITVGRLGSEKNIDEILANLVEILKEHKDIKMLIVGDGPHREALQEEAEKLQITDNVIFTGMVPIEEVHNYYKLGDIFVSASISETQGLTYIEALISGLPLLCRQDDCLNGVLIDGENGFAYNSKEECLAYLRKLLKDGALCARLSVNAAEGAEKFSAKAFGESAAALYERVIENYKKENISIEDTMSI
ncbi:glycosyltransferase [Cellulosilyticum ruminicola]|uniref:glycosyltransferase n=1 Tax=Cellulosilyticum ruminicola TaxID=425254 RepID=UPI0038BCC53C